MPNLSCLTGERTLLHYTVMKATGLQFNREKLLQEVKSEVDYRRGLRRGTKREGSEVEAEEAEKLRSCVVM